MYLDATGEFENFCHTKRNLRLSDAQKATKLANWQRNQNLHLVLITIVTFTLTMLVGCYGMLTKIAPFCVSITIVLQTLGGFLAGAINIICLNLLIAYLENNGKVLIFVYQVYSASRIFYWMSFVPSLFFFSGTICILALTGGN
jgi:hypothetical protein